MNKIQIFSNNLFLHKIISTNRIKEETKIKEREEESINHVFNNGNLDCYFD